MPFGSFDCLPPGYSQTDLVAPRHKDVMVIRKGTLPNFYTVVFICRTVWKLAKRFDQLREVRLMEGVFQAKYTVRSASILP